MRVLILIVLNVFCISNGIAQFALTDPLPMDTSIRKGILPNGLTWYVRHNAMPKNVAELRLVVNAGSLQEADDQQGLAHFTEHMAFNGTRTFAKNQIIDFLQQIGVGFGSDLNAYTSFDETVYQLPVPTNQPGNLEKAFKVMEEWAGAITFLDTDIDNERNIILEESRLGKGAEDRMYQKLYPLMLAGSKYASRLPIGKDSIIRQFRPETLRRYYEHWYRPNLMAVVVVGDIDTRTAEALVKKHFGHLKNPANAPTRNDEPLPAFSQTRGIALSDAEATESMISLTWSAFKHLEPVTVGEYRRDIVRNLFSSMTNQRLQEPTQQEKPPYLGAFIGLGTFARNHQQFSLNVFNGNRAADSALGSALRILEQIRRFGFTQTELDRSAKTLLAGVERANNEKDKSGSEDYAEEYIRNFLTNEPLPGISNETEYHRRYLPTITLDEVNAVYGSLMPNQHFLVAYTGPEVFASDPPDTLALMRVVQAAANDSSIQPYADEEAGKTLLAVLPQGGSVTKETADATMGTKTWWLQNGIRVTVKKTDFKNDQVLLGGRRAGGIMQYGLADRFSSLFTIPAIRSMGFGQFTPLQMRKFMAGKVASVSPSLSETMDQWIGSSSATDVETMLQLLYLQATQPRVDTALFQGFINRSKAQTANTMADPVNQFIDSFTSVLYGHHPQRPVVIPSEQDYDKTNLGRVLAIYNERMGDATGMHFVLVGNINEDSLKPLVARYLGALPVSGRVSVFKDNGVRPVKGNLLVEMKKGQEDKCLALKVYNGEMAYTDRLALQAEAIAELLNLRIVERLREKIQGVYSGSVDGGFSKLPYPHYSFIVQLPTGSEKLDTVLKAMEQEINQLKKLGPSASDLAKIKKQWIEDHRKSLRQNNSWLNQILEMSFPGDKASNFLKYEAMVKSLTTAEIKQAANLLLKDNYKMTAILRPQKAE